MYTVATFGFGRLVDLNLWPTYFLGLYVSHQLNRTRLRFVSWTGGEETCGYMKPCQTVQTILTENSSLSATSLLPLFQSDLT